MKVAPQLDADIIAACMMYTSKQNYISNLMSFLINTSFPVPQSRMENNKSFDGGNGDRCSQFIDKDQ